MPNLVLLITGANTGIGYHVAQYIARISGDVTYTVLVGARNLDKANTAVSQIRKDNPSVAADKIEPLAIDLNSDESIRAAAATVEKKYSVLDILINNAALGGDEDEPHSSRQKWQKIFNTNVFGTYLVTDAFLPLLKKSNAPASPGTRIVNVSSRTGSFGAAVGGHVAHWAMPYSVSKTALNMVSIFQQDLLKETGISVVTVTPAFTATALNGFKGKKKPEDSAMNLIRAATDGVGSELNGKFMEDEGVFLPW